MESVKWRDDWGTIEAVPRHNGPSGQWVDDHILGPLGLTRDDACISDCLDQSRLNPGQAGRIGDTYQPVASALGLPDCTLAPVPGLESATVRKAREGHLERLRAELRQSGCPKGRHARQRGPAGVQGGRGRTGCGGPQGFEPQGLRTPTAGDGRRATHRVAPARASTQWRAASGLARDARPFGRGFRPCRPRALSLERHPREPLLKAQARPSRVTGADTRRDF